MRNVNEIMKKEKERRRRVGAIFFAQKLILKLKERFFLEDKRHPKRGKSWAEANKLKKAKKRRRKPRRRRRRREEIKINGRAATRTGWPGLFMVGVSGRDIWN